MLCKEVQPLNTFLPISFKDICLSGASRTQLSRLIQPSKHESPILVTPVGKLNVLRLWQLAKVFCPITVIAEFKGSVTLFKL